ncbi:MAG: DNA replication and repair protein RecF [Bacteroidales bacterium]|nr:DNA replication and repair protein RecF [Bacteroidales bacterium]
MKLHSLSIYHYRNIEELSFECNERVNCLVGRNGVGKTNILDSIYYLSCCKSNLMTNDALNVKQGEKSFLLQGSYLLDDMGMKVSCAYNLEDKSKLIRCNDKKYARISDHLGVLPVVFISPNDVSLIYEGGTERRKFLDGFISMYNRDYLSNLLVYNKILQQRNTLLKQDQPVDDVYLSIIDEKLSILGTAIFEERKRAVAALSTLTKHFYGKIASTEECSVEYESQLFSNNMKSLLERNRERDLCLTYTSTGIHRDDLSFKFNDSSLKNTASQGQKKTFLLALKFAQYQLISEYKNGLKPLLLLDDLFDKLDKERSKNIFDIVDGQEFGQIFITDTDKILLHTIFEQRKEEGIFWQVSDGKIEKTTL